MQINLSLCRTSECYFSLLLQRLSWDSLGNKNVSSTNAQNVGKVNESCACRYVVEITLLIFSSNNTNKLAG